MTPEGKVKRSIDRLLKSYGKDVWYFKPVSSGMGKHGVPDYIACIKGVFVGVEAKAGSNQPTKLQKLQLRQIQMAGGFALVINEDNLDTLQTVIESCL